MLPGDPKKLHRPGLFLWNRAKSRLLKGIFFCISVNLWDYSAFLVFLFCVTMMEILAASKGREYHAIYVNA